MKTPILLICYHQPNWTSLVLNEIIKANVENLYVFQDKALNSSHTEGVKNVKKLFNNFPGIVKYFQPEKNLGCKNGPVTALKWFFNHVDKGIILEHDSVPNQTFFPFCEDLLEYYNNDNTVMHINGCNFNNTSMSINGYFFSNLMHCWGFATWRRAFKYYDPNISDYPKLNNLAKYLFHNKEMLRKYKKYLKYVYNNKINTWDYQWQYEIWRRNGYCITPDTNLISNIGFGSHATHTTDSTSEFGFIETKEISYQKTNDKRIHLISDNMFIDKYFENRINKAIKLASKKIDLLELKFRFFGKNHNNRKWD